MKVVFFGSGQFGVPTLRMLWDAHELVAVVSQPDRRAGRGSRPAPTPVSGWALERGVEDRLLRPESVNEPAEVERVRAFEADAWVVIAYGQKLSRTLLDDRFAINLHASLLPRWRGAAPINAAVLAGDAQTGNTVITLADRMDAGLVLGQSRRVIDPDQTAGELHDALSSDGPALVSAVLEAKSRGLVRSIEQDESRVTHAPKLGRADSWIDFARPAVEVQRRVHGLTPWPGVAVRMGTLEFKLLRVKATGDGSEATAAGGRLLDAANGIVACGGGSSVRIVELQPAGKRAMRWEQFVRGHRVDADSVLRSVQDRG